MKVFGKSTLLYGATVVSLFAMSTTAQDNLPNLSSASESQSEADAQKSSSDDTAPTTKSDTTASPAKTGSTKGSDSKTAAAETTPSNTNTRAVITGSGEANTNLAPPSITGGSSAANGGALPSGLPTLSGQFKVVPASVPPTQNAPYMQTSRLPEGTVFIIVGAILGFLAMSVLLWRGLVAWSLHRSVKRAAQHQSMTDTKARFQPPAQFYKYSDRDSTISLGRLVEKNGKSNKKNNRPPTAPGAASASSLFFSPTAGAAMQGPGNRGSNYLPAGYYAAGASAPGNNASHISLGHGHGQSISLSNLNPQAQGYSRARSMGPSPPGSPGFRPQSGHAMQSSSTLNLNRGYGADERAPSAYLEDLFDGEGGIPPPTQGQGVHRASGSTARF